MLARRLGIRSLLEIPGAPWERQHWYTRAVYLRGLLLLDREFLAAIEDRHGRGAAQRELDKMAPLPGAALRPVTYVVGGEVVPPGVAPSVLARKRLERLRAERAAQVDEGDRTPA